MRVEGRVFLNRDGHAVVALLGVVIPVPKGSNADRELIRLVREDEGRGGYGPVPEPREGDGR